MKNKKAIILVRTSAIVKMDFEAVEGNPNNSKKTVEERALICCAICILSVNFVPKGF